MSNGHDDIDTWLEREVTPLMPAPGSLDRIRRTARRRKTTQAFIAAAGCAVVIAAAAVVPQLTAGLHHHNSGQTPLAGSSPTAASVRPSSTSSASTSPSSQSSSSSPPHTGLPYSQLSTTTSGAPAPANFQPTSVTFVGADNSTGAVVGAVIGQAGTPGKCATQYCTSLAGTSTYGKSWYGISAPKTSGPNGSDTGVSQLRFLNLSDGWAFGPALWETSQGGAHWTQENTNGLRVTDLEGAGLQPGQGHAFAVFASCSGTGANYATGCTSFSLYSSVAGATTWTPVAVPTPFRTMTTSAPSAVTLVISAGTTGYLLTPSGEMLSGPVTGGSWKAAGMARCKPGAAQADGQPAGAQLAAGPSLVLACDTSGKSAIYTSADGTSWKPAGSVLTSGTATSMASSTGGVIVLATTDGIYYSADMGATWHAATVTSAPAGGFTYVGMTTASDGVAVPADARLGEVFVTSDGGQTWARSSISGS